MQAGTWRWERTPDGLAVFAWDVGPVHVRVSSRVGGTSPRPWDSLNVGFFVGDARERVRDNRRRLFRALDVAPAQVVWAQQVHGGAAAWVGREDGGRGALDPEDAVPGVDALCTAEAGVVLGMGFADCVPVIVADPGRGAVALCHAGWRGTAAGVTETAYGMLAGRLGTTPADVWAGLGPSIGGSYTVDERVMGPLSARYPWVRAHFDETRGALDLAGVQAHVLTAWGVDPGRVAVSPERTECPAFFSHRTDHGRTGRMAALVWIAP